MPEISLQRKNLQEGEEWLLILQENKRVGMIPKKRLEGFLGLLKVFLDRSLGERAEMLARGLRKASRNTTNGTKKGNRKANKDER